MPDPDNVTVHLQVEAKSYADFLLQVDGALKSSRERILDLEARFRHVFFANGHRENEVCAHCGLRLSDPIHIRRPVEHTV